MSWRVLTVTPWFPNTPEDGRFNFILHSVQALQSAGCRPATLVTRPWTPGIMGCLHPDWQRKPLQKKTFSPELGIQVCHYLSVPRNYFHFTVGELYRRTIARSVTRMARALSAQVIHAHTEGAAFAAVPIAKQLGLPVVVTLHGINTAPRQLDTIAKRNRLQRTLAGADRVILVGEPLRDYFVPLAGDDANFCVVPNGFFLPQLPPARVPSRDESTLRLVSISNLHEGKGIDLNLEALAELDRRGLGNWNYTIVGGGAERLRLEGMVDEKGLRDRVQFLGHLPHCEALAKLTSADVFLLPSYREAFGVAYLEAMASGLLVVGVKGQGPEAFIRDGESGFLVPPKDVTALADLIEFVMGNESECRRIADRGREVVTTEFTWTRHAEKLMAVYAEVIG